MDELEKRQGINVVNLQRRNPSYSTCYKCGLPWNECEPKTVKRDETTGMFAMCEYCWDNSTTEERIHHYRSLYLDHKNRWESNYDFSVVEKEIIRMSAEEEKFKVFDDR